MTSTAPTTSSTIDLDGVRPANAAAVNTPDKGRPG
jgi:hypothetical protein